jgi:hypothetical protein
MSLGVERWKGSFLQGRGADTDPSSPRKASTTWSAGLSWTPVRWLTVEARNSMGGAMRGFSAGILLNLDLFQGPGRAKAGSGAGSGSVSGSGSGSSSGSGAKHAKAQAAGSGS